MDKLYYYFGTGLKFQLIHDLREDFEDEYLSTELNDFYKGQIWELAGYSDTTIPLGGGDFNGFLLKKGHAYICVGNSAKPLMRPLSSLTKPITVEGYNDEKPFVPVVELCKMAHGDIYPYLEYDENELDELEVQMIMLCSDLSLLTFDNAELLFRWHFWLFDQTLFGKSLIEIKD